ncbi:MAG TPA: hypothetical protein VN651_12510 [Gemmatimonadaceae bacterium]|nr:hypothetical protein [Gemmatimonadaceae bacterium]
MSSSSKRIREQAVVYLGQRDRELLENLAAKTGLSRTELFRRGLWALAAQAFGAREASAFDHLLAESDQVNGPADLSTRADDYLYGAASDELAVHESTPTHTGKPARKRSPKRARTR